MADIKTNLRELSVIVGIYKQVHGIQYDNTPQSFVSICELALPKMLSNHYASISSLQTFNAECEQILINGFKLAEVIIEKFSIKNIVELNWYGFDAHKEEPYDISVNNIKFSLKEESFILENMGLYKLINCYTDSNYSRRHIFSDYARKEYEDWFAVTWKELVGYLTNHNNCWSCVQAEKDKQAVITLSSDGIKLEYHKSGSLAARSILPLDCSLSCYEKNTDSKTREEVFAKFINRCLDSNLSYNAAKTNCAIVATKALADELTENLNYTAGIARFLRIHTSEYYYAKTTKRGIEIYRIPGVNSFKEEIVIQSISPSVPNKQANIITTILNKKTNKTLVLRNECRFSHGQFNGTPEAKLYYGNNCTLEAIYEKVY